MYVKGLFEGTEFHKTYKELEMSSTEYWRRNITEKSHRKLETILNTSLRISSNGSLKG